jgi:DNA polymerase III subunit epsilon
MAENEFPSQDAFPFEGAKGSPWHELPRAAFDLETTGKDPRTARIVTASIVIVNGRDELLQHHEWLVNPGVPIPEEATAVHGISTEQAVAEGQDPAQATAEIAELLRALLQTMPVMVFNAPYDFTVLEAESRRYGVPSIEPSPVIDPLVIDRAVDRYRRGKRTLGVMAEHYGVSLVDAHTSAADALATIGVADAIARKFPREVQVDPLSLHGAQVNWQAAWAENFQDYLRRKDPSATVDASWPRGAFGPREA